MSMKEFKLYAHGTIKVHKAGRLPEGVKLPAVQHILYGWLGPLDKTIETVEADIRGAVDDLKNLTEPKLLTEIKSELIVAIPSAAYWVMNPNRTVKVWVHDEADIVLIRYIQEFRCWDDDLTTEESDDE